MSNNDESKCPVDHKAQNTGKSWGSTISSMFWAAPVDSKPESTGILDGSKCPVPHKTDGLDESKCPVPPEKRDEWVNKMKQGAGGAVSGAVDKHDVEIDDSCSSSKVSNGKYVYESTVNLPTEREISSIPRTGDDGNWVYPSQKQFFEAMLRKQFNPEKEDMRTIVPIHNAVNEQAWRYIMFWEQGQGGEKCGGIKLTSFKGDSRALTPRARFRSTILGHEKPFDRHDWRVNRCGKEIDYVIDFYSGQPTKDGKPGIVLDVRPKLNSVEGWRLRLTKALGL